MKKLSLFLFLALILSSCSIMKKSSFNETYVIDYQRYASKDFFITESNSVSFEYTPVGSVTTVMKGEQQGRPEPQSIYNAIDEFAFRCVELGANGVTNFQIDYTYDEEHGMGYTVSGMAIKK